jgi:hypothetical protein
MSKPSKQAIESLAKEMLEDVPLLRKRWDTASENVPTICPACPRRRRAPESLIVIHHRSLRRPARRAFITSRSVVTLTGT